jgi:hypothetical protein
MICDYALATLHNIIDLRRDKIDETNQDMLSSLVQQCLSTKDSSCVYWALCILQSLSIQGDVTLNVATHVIKDWLHSLSTSKYDESGNYRQDLPLPSSIRSPSSSMIKCLSMLIYTPEQLCMLSEWVNQHPQLLQEMVQWGDNDDLTACEDLMKVVCNHNSEVCNTSTADDILKECKARHSATGWQEQFISVLDTLVNGECTVETTRSLKLLYSVIAAMDMNKRSEVARSLGKRDILQIVIRVCQRCTKSMNTLHSQVIHHILKIIYYCALQAEFQNHIQKNNMLGIFIKELSHMLQILDINQGHQVQWLFLAIPVTQLFISNIIYTYSKLKIGK